MKKITALSPAILRPACDPKQLAFTTTAEITTFLETIGQERALEALSFGLEMKLRSHHIYALGPAGLGKHYFMQHRLQHIAIKEPPAADWCYVNNFKEPQKPIALKFAPGEGLEFKQDMHAFIEQLHYSIPAMFESREYRNRIEKIESKFKNREEKLLKNISKEARKLDLIILGTPGSYDIVPLLNEEKMTKEQFDILDESTKKELTIKINKIKSRLERVKHEMPQWYKQKHDTLKEIKNDFCNTLVTSLIGELKEKYTDPKVLNYLRNVQEDIIESPIFVMTPIDMETEEDNNHGPEKTGVNRYEVNVIVSHDKEGHAPIITESHPNYTNLVGQLEGTPQHGTLTSDFTLIKAGALHFSNGGYLMVEIKKLLKDMHAWDSLKRILIERKITIEPLQSHALGATQLQPEPIPLEVKVILLGDRNDYESLEDDDDFNKLFKVIIEFETTIKRTDDLIQQFVFYMARIIKKRKLGPFHRDAVALIIDHCIRITDESQKISLQRNSIVEILEESRYWANKYEQKIVRKEDVEIALAAKIRRLDKMRCDFYEDILSGSILIDVEGEAVGQVNGISIIELPDFYFGIPTRITATTRSGKESVIDIQREVDLGGANHSKGVLILSGFLKGRYAKDIPFFLSASLVMEQTYGRIEGDSASLGELCALISSLANIPIKQALAVTGSVNQLGFTQPVGGINEKIEGFFDICYEKGLTGEQGVLIPATNIKNLMLKQEVVNACSKGDFHIYSIQTVDEALALLTGRDPEEIHLSCDVMLRKYAESRRGILE